MSILLPLINNPNVRAGIVFKPTGALLEALGEIDAESTAALLAMMADYLGQLATTLGLGTLKKSKVTGNPPWLLVTNKSVMLAVCPQPGVKDGSLDELLAGVAWDQAGDAAPLLEATDRPAAPEPEATPAKGGAASAAAGAVPLTSILAFADALRLRQDDTAALRALVASGPSLSRRWLEHAQHQVALAIARGEMDEAEVQRRLACAVLEELASKAPADVALRDLYLETIPKIQQGLEQLQRADASAESVLDQLVERLPEDCPLRWAVAIWQADCAHTTGRPDRALKISEQNLQRVQGRDRRAEGMLHLTIARALFATRKSDAALAQVRLARQASSAADDREMLAREWLLEARLLTSSTNSHESVRCARNAHDVFPGWPEPLVFLARQAAKDNKLWKAEALLREAVPEGDVLSPEIAWEFDLLERIRNGSMSPLVVAEYLHLDEAVASDEVLEKLMRLDADIHDIPHLKLTIVWKLLALGRRSQAIQYFEQLVNLDRSVAQTRLVPHYLRRWKGGDGAAKAGARAQAEPPAGQPQEAPAPSAAPAPTPAPPPAAKVTSTGLSSVGRESVFSGELQLFALPDLLEFLRIGHRSGALVINGPAGSGAIYLRDGMIVSASSPASGNLGTILMESGKVTRAQIERCVKAREKDSSRRMGLILVEDEHVSAADISDAIASQVARAMREMVTWTTGRFAFEPDREDTSVPTGLTATLDPQSVLLDVFRIMDEENRDSDAD